MNPKFDPNQPFSKVYGPSPAAYFQNAHYFSGDGTYLTWAQAAGEEKVPTTAAETEIQSREAAERIANREKADSRVQADPPQFDSRTLVGQPSSEEAVEEARTTMGTT